MADLPWLSPPAELSWARHTIHVWRAPLDAPASSVERLCSSLADDERRRAEAFRFPRDRARYIIGRATLRLLLGRYLNCDPGRLRFRYGAHDKPALAPEFGGDIHRFNMSHSHGLALIALTQRREIGVDLERIRPEVALADIARRFFSPGEVTALFSLPEGERVDAFFACWTRKEAYIKAKGEGLAIPLDQFDVSLGRDAPPAIVSTRWDPAEASRWSLRDLHPGPDFAAAVAVEGEGGEIACFQWSG